MDSESAVRCLRDDQFLHSLVVSQKEQEPKYFVVQFPAGFILNKLAGSEVALFF